MSRRLLSRPFDLPMRATGEVVEDLEKLCRGVMAAEKWPIFLEPADNDELLTHLLGEAVILEGRYDPPSGIVARLWLFQRLGWKARDWRESFMRHVTPAALPELDDDEHGLNGRVDAGSHGSPSEVSGDRGDPGHDALRGLLESGDRALLREIKALGLGPPPGARGSSPGAQRRLATLDRERRRRVRELEARTDRVAA